MSLINEALKKAQRLRSADPVGDTRPGFGTQTPVTKRGQARSSQTIVLIGSGALVLVVLSVVATFWFVNRPSPSSAARAAATKTSSPKSSSATEAPPVVLPSLTPAPTSTSAAPTPGAPSSNPGASAGEKTARAGEQPNPNVASVPPTETKTAAPPPAPAPTTPNPTQTAPANSTPPPAATSVATSTPAPTSPPAENPATSPATPPPEKNAATAPTSPPATAAAAAGPAKPDDRVAAYIEALRITAIRASANDSKVFMNDKVYRVNEVVERNLGIKLIKVAPDSLTFVDPKGVTYVKYF